MKHTVRVTGTFYFTVEVEAESGQEARSKAYGMLNDNLMDFNEGHDGSMLVFDDHSLQSKVVKTTE